MSATQQFVTFLSFAIMVAPYGEADRRLPAPRKGSHNWIDRFVVEVNWTWLKPTDLPQNCVVKFEIQQKDKPPVRVEHKYFTQYYLTEDFTSNSLELSIYSKPETGCQGWNESEPEKVLIKAPKDYAELVRDFRCFYLSNGINCSWIPVDPSESLKVSYRSVGKSKEDIQSLKACEPYKMKGNGCYLERETNRETFVLVETETRMNTFKPKIAIYVPELSINETEAYLKLTWTNPVVGNYCPWRYCLWYKECGNNKPLLCYEINNKPTVNIPYKKCCGYEFQYNISTNNYCPEVSSDTSKIIPYGTTRSCISTANVVAIIFPIIICFCVALSFYCFKKHENIFDCTRLDPSVIKEILNVNNNKTSWDNLIMQHPGEHTDTFTSLVPRKEEC